MKNSATDAMINIVNRVAEKACAGEGGRKNGSLERPLEYDENRKIYVGFLSDWSGDCRMNLYYGLLNNTAYKTAMYDAPYFWRVSNGVIEIEYIEGDLYGKVIEKTI